MAKITERIVTIKDKGAELEREVREKTLGYIITSFGLVAGLAWNDAIKGFIEKYFVDSGSGLQAKFLYAFLMTVVVVAISLYLSRLLKVKKKDKAPEIVEVLPVKKVEAKIVKKK